MGFVVTDLTDYVKTNQDALVKSAVLGEEYGDVIPYLRHQLGVKTKEKINLLEVDPELQSYDDCGFNASGSTDFSEREIDTAQIKVNDKWCPRDLLGKFAEYQVGIGASDNPLPFGEVITKEIVRKVNDKMEKLVWQGDSDSDLMDGFIKRASETDAASTVAVSIASGTSVYDAIKAVINKIPEVILDRAIVFVSPALYRAFVFEMVEKNLYHFAPNAEVQDVDIYFPATNVRVHKTKGLTGDLKHIYASVYENMVYGTDLLDNKEDFKLWFSDDDDVWKLKMSWNAGVQTLYPDMVVLGTAAANLA